MCSCLDSVYGGDGGESYADRKHHEESLMRNRSITAFGHGANAITKIIEELGETDSRRSALEQQKSLVLDWQLETIIELCNVNSVGHL
jgi:hypothetical protein